MWTDTEAAALAPRSVTTQPAAPVKKTSFHDYAAKSICFIHGISNGHMITVPGPYGERDEQQVFIQRVVPDTDKLYVRLSSNGKR